tara:strand:+ start:397 stop:648 length:252 start_codon:yes stop_codon:yes gene_type:complete
MNKKKQTNLFEELGVEENWREEWQDMPEFVQKDKEPLQKIIVSFASLEDVKEFGKLINQNLTYKTKSIWFPEVKKGQFKNFIY